MMDVWLIFNLILPFTEVLLHTWKVGTKMFGSAVFFETSILYSCQRVLVDKNFL